MDNTTQTERRQVRAAITRKGTLEIRLRDNGDGTWAAGLDAHDVVIEGDTPELVLRELARVLQGVNRGVQA